MNKRLYRYVRGWIQLFQGITVIFTFGFIDPDWDMELTEFYLKSMFAGFEENNK